MTTNRSQLFTAGALLLATAAAGVAVNGVSRAHAPIPTEHQMTFTAPSTGPVKFTGALDRTAVLIGRDGVARMELVMSAAAGESRQSVRRPTDVVIIFDRSGSMSGDKLVDARAAVDALLAQLGAQDRFALVAPRTRRAWPFRCRCRRRQARWEWRATVADSSRRRAQTWRAASIGLRSRRAQPRRRACAARGADLRPVSPTRATRPRKG